MSLIINDTTYSGTYASYFWIPATFNLDTIQKGIAFVQDGIKKKHTIDRLDFSTPLQERQATPTSSGNFTIDYRSLEPADIMLYTEFNPRNFESNFRAEELSRTLLTRELPVTAENYMMQIALNRAFEQIETCIWMGSTSYTAPIGSAGNGQLKFFDGFMKKMVVDTAVQKISSPKTLVATATDGSHENVLEAFDRVLSKVAVEKKALLSDPKRYEKLKFIISINTELLYAQALATGTAFKGTPYDFAGVPKWKGYEVVSLAGVPDNTIIFCKATPDVESNLYVGMNSTEDNNLQLQRLQNNSELFFFKGLMKYDVQYAWSEQTFLYTTYVAADFNV